MVKDNNHQNNMDALSVVRFGCNAGSWLVPEYPVFFLGVLLVFFCVWIWYGYFGYFFKTGKLFVPIKGHR